MKSSTNNKKLIGTWSDDKIIDRDFQTTILKTKRYLAADQKTSQHPCDTADSDISPAGRWTSKPRGGLRLPGFSYC